MISSSDASLYISPSWSKKAHCRVKRGVFTYSNITCKFWDFYVLLSTHVFRDHSDDRTCGSASTMFYCGL